MAIEHIIDQTPKDFFHQREEGYLRYYTRLFQRLKDGVISEADYLARLARASAVKDNRTRRLAQENLTDHLTSKPNSRAAELVFEHLRKEGNPEAIYMVDVDNAKNGNSEIGHAMTNGAIVEVVDASDVTLNHFTHGPIEMLVLRRGEEIPTQGVMRMHNRGDEFFVFTRGLKTKRQRKKFAEYLRTTYFNSSPIQELNRRVSLPFSITVVGAIYHPDQEPEEFINSLSAGPLQQAKSQGKNCTIVI